MRSYKPENQLGSEPRRQIKELKPERELRRVEDCDGWTEMEQNGTRGQENIFWVQESDC